MSAVEFHYEGNSVDIQCNSDQKMEQIINKYTTKIRKKPENLNFIYSGEIVNKELTFDAIVNKLDKKRNKMSVLVNNIFEKDYDYKSLKKSLYIICPECKENARISIDNYIKITIYDCKNGHKVNISIQDFDKSQNYDQSKIICDNCKNNNKSILYNNFFYICFDCKKNLCLLCKLNHDKNHNIIDYNEKFFNCDLHYESYKSYCSECKKDICISCEMEHKGHKIISYEEILPNLNKINEERDKLYKKKEEMKNEIKKIINKLNDLMNILDNNFKIYENIIYSYNNKKINYSILQNIEDMNKYSNFMIEDMNTIINEKNMNNKFNEIIKRYEKIILEQKEIKNEDKSNSKNMNINYNDNDNDKGNNSEEKKINEIINKNKEEKSEKG